MKNIVITGGTRGLGFELARCLIEKGCRVMICGTTDVGVAKAVNALGERACGCRCDVSKPAEVEALAEEAVRRLGGIDIWINNAGINQTNACVWELSDEEIDLMLGVDLRGAINGSNVAMRHMIAQGHGAIYNVEGHGSNDAVLPGLSLYGTAKRAVTYFTDALAKEVREKALPVVVGKLSPGIMITDFLTAPKGQRGKGTLDEKTKRVYNILGDRPDVIAAYLGTALLENKVNGRRIEWLTGRKAAWRFMTAAFNKRDFFK